MSFAEFEERRAEGKGYYLRGTRDTVRVGAIHPNPWNPNRLTERQFEGLKGAIRRHGFMQEVLVRPHPVNDGEYQTIDGEHRSKAVEILSDLDPDAPVDVRIVSADDAEARLITLFMNRDRGEHDRVDEAHLLAELEKSLGREALEEVLPWGADELGELISLAAVDWDGYEAEPGEAGGAPGDGDPGGWVRFEVAMTGEDHASYLEAKRRIEAESPPTGDAPVSDGQAIAALAAEYLGGG